MTEDDLAAAFAGSNQFVMSQAIRDDFVQWLQALNPKVDCLRMCRRQTWREWKAAGSPARPTRWGCFEVLTSAQQEAFLKYLFGYGEMLCPAAPTEEK